MRVSQLIGEDGSIFSDMSARVAEFEGNQCWGKSFTEIRAPNCCSPFFAFRFRASTCLVSTGTSVKRFPDFCDENQRENPVLNIEPSQ